MGIKQLIPEIIYLVVSFPFPELYKDSSSLVLLIVVKRLVLPIFSLPQVYQIVFCTLLLANFLFLPHIP